MVFLDLTTGKYCCIMVLGTFYYITKEGNQMKLKTILAATLITATMATTAPMAATPAVAATTTASTTAATTTKTWKDTKYSKPLTRYTSKNKVKVRSGATSTSKVVKTYKKGVKLTVVGKTNTGYFKLNNGYYVLITSVTKTKPGTSIKTNKTTTNTQYPEDKYGPGENGYPELGPFVENVGDGWGYVFVDCEMTLESLPEMNEGYCFTKKKLTAVGGKDIPYGWYCIVGDLADGNYERIQYPTDRRPTIDIYGTNGKLREYGIYTKGEIFYLGKGEKIIARNLVMAPAKNGTITYRGAALDPNKVYGTELQQSSLVTAKGTGYGIEAGKYKVVVDPDTERFDTWDDGAWIYKVGDYANIETVTYRQLGDGSCRTTTRNIVATGKFLYSDTSLAPDSDPDLWMKFWWEFDKNGTPYDGIHKDMLKSNKQPASLTPKTITLNAGDLVICRGATLVKVG